MSSLAQFLGCALSSSDKNKITYLEGGAVMAVRPEIQVELPFLAALSNPYCTFF